MPSKEKVQIGEDITKAESHERLPVPSSRELGYNGIVDSRRFIDTLAQTELQYPRLLNTVEKMMQDDAVSTAVSSTNQQTVLPLHKGMWKGNTAKGKVAAEFLNYSIRNLTYGSWFEFCQDAVTCLQNGFSLVCPVLEKRNYGQYKGSYCLKKLSPRSQRSVYGWVWDDPMQNVIGFVQKPKWSQKKPSVSTSNRALRLLDTPKLKAYEYTYIPLSKTLHFKNKGGAGNPQGYSQCAGIYETWLEKQILQHLELTGAQKDLAGTLITRVPSELVVAAKSGNDPEATKEYEAIQTDTANVHNGTSTGLVLLSDRDSSGNFHYDVELKGITGSGKQIDIATIIDAKRNAIFNAFSAQFLILGQGDVGSNAIALTGKTVHDRFVEHQVAGIVEVLNNQLAPLLLAANGVHLDYKDMPTFVTADPSPKSMDEWSKWGQRLGSLGLVTETALTHMYDELKIPTDGIEDLDFNSGNISQAGRGNGTSGAGQEAQANSAINSDNAE